MKKLISDSTKRFSDRVENYVKFRPHYPKEIIPFLKSELGLLSSHSIVDVGSGTGILTQLFLKNGNKVYGIEPNAPMREAGEKFLSEYNSFESINATAEETSLKEKTADFIVAGQAFHWFDPVKTKNEFKRILRPGGYVILIWNDRKDTTSLGGHYEWLLKKFGTDYDVVSAKYDNEGESVREFLSPGRVKVRSFENEQQLDFGSFKGRLLSSSYAPGPDHPNYELMLEELRQLFDSHQKNQLVKMEYETKLYYGRFETGR